MASLKLTVSYITRLTTLSFGLEVIIISRAMYFHFVMINMIVLLSFILAIDNILISLCAIFRKNCRTDAIFRDAAWNMTQVHNEIYVLGV